jgi:DNA polymerase V
MRLRQCTDVETNILVDVLCGKVQGGFPNPADDYYEPPISLDELLNLRAPHIWLAETDGDSMSGVGIYHGTLLVIDRSVDAEVGDVVVVYVNNQPVVKRLDLVNGCKVLSSENPLYPPITVGEFEEVESFGIVIWSFNRHGRRCR